MRNIIALVFCIASALKVSAVEIEMKTPSNHFVEEGEEVIMQCTHLSDSDITSSTLVLTLNDKEITLDENHKNSLGVASGRTMFYKYEIHKATFADAGKYTCLSGPGSTDSFVLNMQVYRVVKESALVSDNITSAELRCNTEYSPQNTNYGKEKPKRVQWFKKTGSKFIAVNESEGKVVISDLHDSLNISNIEYSSYEDVGEYMCEVKPDENARTINYTLAINTAAGVIPYKGESTKGIQGDNKQVSCAAYGFPLPTVLWTLDNVPLNFDDRRKASSGVGGVTNSTIMFSPLEEEDRGNYTCVVTNEYGSGMASIVVRVKDRYAALWPFLGICAEVAILCAVIFFFEKRRARKMREEEEDPAAADRLMNHDREEELRQRKVQA